MGLLDGLLGSVLSGAGGQQGGLGGLLGGLLGGGQAQDPKAMLMQAALGMLMNKVGGGAMSGMAGGAAANPLGGLLEAFTQNGMGDQAQSWVGTGANMPISADQITGLLGSLGGGNGADILGQLAGGAGMNHAEAGGALAQMLPGLIDKLTPNGQLPSELPSGDALSGILGQLLGGK